MRALLPVLCLVAVACKKKDEGTAPSDDELVVEGLGTFPVPSDGGYVDVDVTVPAGAVSTMAYCGEWGDTALGNVWSVSNPGGTEVYNGYQPDAGGFRSDYLDDMAPGLLPMTPDLLPTEGAWHFQWYVDVGSDGDAECGVVHRVDTLSDPAAVFVEFVFVDVPGLDAASAPDDAGWQEVLATFEGEWGSGGVAPTYSYVDFAGDKARFGVVDIVGDDYSEFNDLLRTSAPESLRTLTVFLVQEVSSDGATILGLSGGPPGAAAVHGTSKSGVVVSTVDLAAAPADVGKILAHEGGHFLGLWHTTEKDGQRDDPLGDTPECPPSADADGNGTLNSTECGGQGAENVMWWTLTTGDATLSNDQGFVLRSNPVAD